MPFSWCWQCGAYGPLLMHTIACIKSCRRSRGIIILRIKDVCKRLFWKQLLAQTTMHTALRSDRDGKGAPERRRKKGARIGGIVGGVVGAILIAALGTTLRLARTWPHSL